MPGVEMTPRSIRVRIEQLTLYGFASRDRYAIAEAVQREIGRQIVERGLPPSMLYDRAVDRLDAGEIRVGGTRPDGVGAQVGAALFEGLTR
jgi:hypothetical protein